MIGGRGGGRSETKLVLASSQWYSVARLGGARSHHACAPVSLNGRAGVVVSGGRGATCCHVELLRHYTEPAPGNATSVDFWDMATNVWVQLPSLNRGRRSHTMTTIEVSSPLYTQTRIHPPLPAGPAGGGGRGGAEPGHGEGHRAALRRGGVRWQEVEEGGLGPRPAQAGGQPRQDTILTVQRMNKYYCVASCSLCLYLLLVTGSAP